jgi:retron-type reverse transcriptase
MGLFHFLKRLLGGSSQNPYGDSTNSPISHQSTSDASTANRDLQSRPHQTPATQAPSPQVPPQGSRPPQGPPGLFSGKAQDGPTKDQPSKDKPKIASKFSGLSTEKFAPLTMDQALAETSQVDWKSAYFDSPSVIPAEDLPRIRVIDRTMVGLGLITEEELAEIHQVGREMDQYRNQGAAIASAGREAVARSKQELARIKEEKKQQAAEKKLRHAAAVAHRKATDIFYLGRGVSRGLHDRRSNVEKLAANQLPVLSTPAELAEAMQINVSSLRWLAFHNPAPSRIHYVRFTVPKKSGGMRELSAPHRRLARAQRWILEKILQPLPTHDAAHGFVSGRSTVTNAEPHVGADLLINADLCDFFPTINFYRVEGLFRSFGYSPAVATILGLLCTESPRQQLIYGGETFYAATGPRALPQGTCTSPALSNLICRNLDNRFTAIANRLGWNYTRYADDLSFSAKQDRVIGENATSIGYVMARIRHIAEDEGFEINEKKTRVLRNNTRQSVTGVVVNDRMSISRKTIRRLRAILHQARHDGLQSQNRENRPDFSAWLRGMIAYVEMVNPDKGKQLRCEFDAISN